MIYYFLDKILLEKKKAEDPLMSESSPVLHQEDPFWMFSVCVCVWCVFVCVLAEALLSFSAADLNARFVFADFHASAFRSLPDLGGWFGASFSAVSPRFGHRRPAGVCAGVCWQMRCRDTVMLFLLSSSPIFTPNSCGRWCESLKTAI